MDNGQSLGQLHVNSEGLFSTVSDIVPMTIDDKIRYGMIALTGSSVVLAAFGVHINPLAYVQGFGTG
jgi:hypothetical protein